MLRSSSQLNHPSQSPDKVIGSATKHFLSIQETEGSKEMKNTRKRSRAGLTEESDTTASSPYVDATVPEQEVDPEPVTTPNYTTNWDDSWSVKSPSSSGVLDPNSSLTVASDVSLMIPPRSDPDVTQTTEKRLRNVSEDRDSRKRRDDDVLSVSASWDNRSSVIERTPSRGQSCSTPTSDLRDDWLESNFLDTSLHLEPDSTRSLTVASDITLADGPIVDPETTLLTKQQFRDFIHNEDDDRIPLNEKDDSVRDGTPDWDNTFIPETPSGKEDGTRNNRDDSWTFQDGSDISLNLEPNSSLTVASDITLVDSTDVSFNAALRNDGSAKKLFLDEAE